MQFLRFSLLVVLLLASACSARVNVQSETISTTPKENPENPKAKNIILMIGDGMGLTQITSGMLANNNRLNLERSSHIGLMKTSSSAEVITDSAAGATAFSIGKKTYNGAIGVDQDTVTHETILEMLGKEGYSTGLIATCRITHATPASFYAHQPKRSMGYEIAADMVNAPVTLFIGGGMDHFVKRVNPDSGTPDDRDIVNELRMEKDFTINTNLDQLPQLDGRVGIFTAVGHPVKMSEGRGDLLPRSIPMAINHLEKESDKGFFMLVEGSQIDWGGHANDGDYIVSEMLDFDQAVGKALDFAAKDGNTLVVITADHETGGFGLGAASGNYKKTEHQFTTGGHTATMVPVFAYGPGSELFSGMYENNTIYDKMLKAMGR